MFLLPQEHFVKLLKKKLNSSNKLRPISKDNIKQSIAANVNLLNSYKENLKNLVSNIFELMIFFLKDCKNCLD